MTGLDGWEPVPEEVDDVLTPAVAAALHGLLDAPGDPPAEGDPIPPLWHWLAFAPRVPQRELGADGHPRTGRFLPPVTGRRMWAGGRLTFAPDRAPRIGQHLRRRSEVSKVEEKEGRSGRLVFVTIAHEVRSTGDSDGSTEAAVHELQDIVYRPPVDATASARATTSPGRNDPAQDPGWDFGLDLVPDPTLLFRFSALTYNAHRIHYDRPYATEVEGYEGLVVHGPLQAIALAELCRRHLPDRPLRSFQFRGLRPAFDGNPLRLGGRVLDRTNVRLVALDSSGEVTMQADASFDPAGAPTSGE